MTTTGNDDRNAISGEVIRAFLLAPLNRRHFDAFFQLCLRLTLIRLNVLRVKGFRLPPPADNQAQGLRDLAYDVLGSLLRNERERQPFHIVFDFFAKSGVSEANQIPADELYRLLQILVTSFVRQEVFRLNQDDDPQRANLKRRFSDILDEWEYATSTDPGDGADYVSLARNHDNLRRENPMISYDRLLALVESAFLETTNRRKWCAAIFTALEGETDVQNRLRKHELLSAVVAICMRYIETEGFQPAQMATPETDLDAATLTRSRFAAVNSLKETVLRDFVRKRKLCSETADHFAAAADYYLGDLIAHGNNDPIPEYFREVMPAEEHDKYLKTYKYIFETVISRVVEDFRKRLRE